MSRDVTSNENHRASAFESKYKLEQQQANVEFYYF